MALTASEIYNQLHQQSGTPPGVGQDTFITPRSDIPVTAPSPVQGPAPISTPGPQSATPSAEDIYNQMRGGNAPAPEPVSAEPIVPPKTEAPSRGIIGQTLSSLARGTVVGIPETAGNLAEAYGHKFGITPLEQGGAAVAKFAEKIPESIPFLQRSKEEINPKTATQKVVNAITGVVESVPSLLPQIAAITAGTTLGTLAGGPAGGYAGGAAATAATFGMGAYNRGRKKALAEGKSPEDAEVYGNKLGIANAILWSLMGPAQKIAGAGVASLTKPGVAPTIAALLTPKLSKHFAELAVSTPMMVGTAGAEAAIEAKLTREAGMEAPSSKDAFMQSIGPSVAMNTMFHIGGAYIRRVERKATMYALEHADAPAQDRLNAAGRVYAALKENNPELSPLWLEAAGKDIGFDLIRTEDGKGFILKPIKGPFQPQPIDLSMVLPLAKEMQEGLLPGYGRLAPNALRKEVRDRVEQSPPLTFGDKYLAEFGDPLDADQHRRAFAELFPQTAKAGIPQDLPGYGQMGPGVIGDIPVLGPRDAYDMLSKRKVETSIPEVIPLSETGTDIAVGKKVPEKVDLTKSAEIKPSDVKTAVPAESTTNIELQGGDPVTYKGEKGWQVTDDNGDGTVNIGKDGKILGPFTPEQLRENAPGFAFQPTTSEEFQSSMGKSERSGFLSKWTDEERAGMKLYKVPGRDIGYAITKDGEITNVFNNDKTAKGQGLGALAVIDGIKNGGNHGSAFDGYLADMYTSLGMVETGRVPFDPKQAPPDWDYKTYGTPDVVFYKYGGKPGDPSHAIETYRKTTGVSPGEKAPKIPERFPGLNKNVSQDLRDVIRRRFPDRADTIIKILDAMGFPYEKVYGKIGGTPSEQALQRKGERILGETDFINGGRAIVTFFEGADVSTAIHEPAHVMRRFFLNRAVPKENRIGITDQDIANAELFCGVGKDGVWSKDAEEKLARAWERYWREGKSPTPALDSLFGKLREWLVGIYKKLKGSEIDIKISPEMRQVFDHLATRGMVERGEMGILKPKGQMSLFGQVSGKLSKGAKRLQQMFTPHDPWRSTLEDVVDAKMSGSMPVAQLTLMLRNNGVKADEMKWTGLDDWLQGKAKVSKQEVQEFIRQNQVQVREVVKGDQPVIYKGETDRMAAFAQWVEDTYGIPYNDLKPTQEASYTLEFETIMRQPGGGTKFSQWQLPGGENYRELLLTLPEKELKAATTAEMKAWWEKQPGTKPAFEELSDGNYMEIARRVTDEKRKGSPEFKSSHFDEPNILAHIRFNDRTDAQGKRVLFIEEVQSDWHQAGREKGYRSGAESLDALHTERNAIQSARAEYVHRVAIKYNDHSAMKNLLAKMDQGETDVFQKFTQQLDAIDKKISAESSGVPPAPFSKTWHEMAMRRMVRWAAENGYDKVAWTTGEQQAERYNQMLRDVTEVQYKPMLEQGSGDQRWDISVKTRDGTVVMNKTVPENELKSVVGANVAKDIIEDAGHDHRVEGYNKRRYLLYPNGITIGGEGMKGFYDKILLEYMNKFGKKWGVKVGESQIPEFKDALNWHMKVHSIPITEAMRESAMREGFPLFQKKKVRPEYEPAPPGMVHGVRYGDQVLAGTRGHSGNVSTKQWVERLGTAPDLTKVEHGYVDADGKFYPKDPGIDKLYQTTMRHNLEEQATGLKKAWEGLKRLVAPTTLGPNAYKAGADISQLTAEKARAYDVFIEQTGVARKNFNRMSIEEQYDFAQRMSTGQSQATPALQATADVLEHTFQNLAEYANRLVPGAIVHVRENYWPGVWKQKTSVEQAASMRPIEPTGFTKPKVFQEFNEAIAAGYEPVDPNPITQAAVKIAEMQKFILIHEALQAGAKWGNVMEIPSGGQKPPGWHYLPEPYGVTKNGRYAVTDETFPVYRNYFSRPLSTNEYFGPWYRGYMKLASTMNQFQLFGAFHAGFVTSEAIVGKGALAFKQVFQVMRGEESVGNLFKTMAEVPVAFITKAREGGKIYKEWSKPGQQGADIAQMAEDIVMAGGRRNQDQLFRTDHVEQFNKALRDKSYIQAALKSPAAAMELAMKPIMTWYVPRLKFGAFTELAQEFRKVNPNATPTELQAGLRQIWNRIDSRLGQVVYDRMFMNNAVKNVMQALIRAPGWTGGTLAEIGGAPLDAARFVKEWSQTGKMPTEMPDRVAYVLSLAVTVAVANGALTYLLTGDKPKDMMDFLAFRTGVKDANGDPERGMLPTYAKDVYAWKSSPVSTALHKTNPLLSTLATLLKNQDYYGTKVVSSDAGTGQKIGEIGQFLAKAYQPFFVTGIMRNFEEEKGALRTVGPVVGVMPAPSYFNQTPAERLARELSGEYMSKGGVEKSRFEAHQLVNKYAKQYQIATRDNKPTEDIMAAMSQEMQAGKLTRQDMLRFRQKLTKDPLTMVVNKMSMRDTIRVWDVANREERRQLATIMFRKYRNMPRSEEKMGLTARMQRISEELSSLYKD